MKKSSRNQRLNRMKSNFNPPKQHRFVFVNWLLWLVIYLRIWVLWICTTFRRIKMQSIPICISNHNGWNNLICTRPIFFPFNMWIYKTMCRLFVNVDKIWRFQIVESEIIRNLSNSWHFFFLQKKNAGGEKSRTTTNQKWKKATLGKS